MRLQTQVAPEIQKRLLLSRVEAESLKERDILCPTCGFRIQRVFSDATGHLSVKCQKCKNVHILNLAYFRRIRRNGYSRNCVLQLHTEMLCSHRPENREDNTSRCRTDGHVYPYV